MDFFQAQDLARRNSRLLVLWFALAVAGIISTLYVLAIVLLNSGDRHGESLPFNWWEPQLFGVVAVGVGGIILLGSLYKTLTLAHGGGAVVATELGGRLVPRDTLDPLERRLINVVEEMAIAAGMAVPPVYVLDEESGINAFAAGSRPANSVVAVTRGALEQLSRDELQGVMAHEFSHILNGDMRLNMRLIGVLHGILLLSLAGRLLLNSSNGSSSNSKTGTPIVMLGACLMILGYLGVLFGKLIKAAISREREYLADASAVQFTRNPDGIANALRRIGGVGSVIQHPRAESASHMFFGNSLQFSRWLATHPPLLERIARLQPNFDPRQANVDGAPSALAGVQQGADDGRVTGFDTLSGSPLAQVGQLEVQHVDQARALLGELPPDLIDSLHSRQQAPAALFALLLAPQQDEAVRTAQLATLTVDHGPDIARLTLQHATWLTAQTPERQGRLRLPIIDLALPTLRELPGSGREAVLRSVDSLIHADGRTSLNEFLLRRLLRDHLRRDADTPQREVDAGQLKTDVTLLLAWLARAGHRQHEAVQQAFNAATAQAPMDGPWSLPAETVLRDSTAVDNALSHLAACTPRFRKGLLTACLASVQADGHVSVREYEMLRTIAQALDCPMPLPNAD